MGEVPLLPVIYALNIAVAGFVGTASLFFPEFSARQVFQGTVPNTLTLRLVGCLWLSIAALSVLGLHHPLRFSPVLLAQFIYEATWLGVVALPGLQRERGQRPPLGITVFFAIWVAWLAVCMPYAYLFGQ